ncbi:MAG: hypothetical protein ACLQC7_04535 [Thermoplasmata archaeon]
MEAITAVPTRVDPGSPRTLSATVAHGPERRWEKVGETVVVSVTIPVTLLRWAREADVVLSRVLREALDRLRGGSDLTRIETELRSHQEQVRILEAARDRMLETQRLEEAGRAIEQARLSALRAVADAFYANGRDNPRQFGKVHNLNWLKARLADTPPLRGSRPEEVLGLILALRGDYRPEEGAA